MKTFLQPIRIVAAIGVLLATSHAASAAQRTFASVTPNPTSTNVMVGVATNVTVTVVIANGTGGSTFFKGTAQLTASSTNLTVTTSPTVQSSTANYFTAGGQTWSPTVTISTTAATPAGTYSIQFVADTNSPPTPDIDLPVTNTFTLIVSSGAPFVPQTIWTNGIVSSNWSAVANWTAGSVPTSSNDVLFIDNSAAPTSPGITDNIVDVNLLIGSLTYGQTNTTHTTLINPGVTLAVGGDTNGLNAGTGTDNGAISTFSAISGSTLVVSNSNASVFVSQGTLTQNNAPAMAQATLDLSSLNTFNATVSRLLVGVDLTIRGVSGQLNLARTNNITAAIGSTAPQIDVGDNSQTSGAPAIPSILLLGQTNSILADSIEVGRGKADQNMYGQYLGSIMAFNSAFSSPVAYFRGTNGASSRVGTWSIGDGSDVRSWYTYGTCDFSSGTVNALVSTMYIGLGSTTSSSEPNPGVGTLTFQAGTIDVNTLEICYISQPTYFPSMGTVNANGGSLLVNTFLEIAHGSGTSGILNISNATVSAKNGITVGGGTATINMTGGTLAATNANAMIGTSTFPLNSFSVSNSTLNLPVQALFPSVATENIVANGNTNIINVSAVPVLSGFPAQFPVIQYGLNGGSASGNTGTFGLGTLPVAVPAYSAYISNNVANNSIDIVFTSGPFIPALAWNGEVNGNWDLTTTNWIYGSGNTTYANGDFVTFNDSLTGTPNVNLTTALMPGSITANNSAENYSFGGSGSIGGNITFVKYGSGTLTLGETGGDNFSSGFFITNGTLILDDANSSITGGTVINGGTLQIGNNDVNGVVPAGNVTDSGTLVFDHSNNISVTNAISGPGTLTQNGTNIVTLTGNNTTFTGTPIVAQGTLQIGSSNSIFVAASGITVSNGATLDTFGQALYGGSSAITLTASGAGVGGEGAIVNNGTSTPTQVFHIVNLTGDTTFGGMSAWDIRNSSGKTAPADAQLNGPNGPYNLTKVDSNTVTLQGIVIDGSLENISVQGGTLHITASASAPLSGLGDATATATVFSNATLTLDTIGVIPGKNFVLTNGGELSCSSTNTLTDPLALQGAANNSINVGGSSLFTITTPITGNGGFTKTGSGPLLLEATNTYTGNTTISGGTLALYGGGANGLIASSTSINITGGATLDVSGRSDDTFTLVSGQTLNGGAGTNAGSINGILIAGAGSILAPGTGTTNTGGIDVTGNATLQGATQMKLNASTGSNDVLRASAIVYGVSLTVTNAIGAITNGQTFQLFVSSNGVYNAGSFSGGVTLPSATGLTWTNNLTVNGTITAGVVAVPPTQPTITGFNLTGNQLIISGTSSTVNLSYTYSVLTSTNLLVPVASWTVLSTGNSFNPGGNFRITNTVNPAALQNYYLLRVP
jgi:fibronectin-binding autotransporter adhesin